MEDTYTIYIGGLERHIASYEHMLLKEHGSLEMDTGPITTLQYLSCLFNNLGYDKCPQDFIWLKQHMDIEEIAKTEVFDYPITKNPLMIMKDYNLFALMMCIRNWIRAGIERGHILDANKSFRLPNRKEIEYCIQNRMKVFRSVILRPKIESWDKADILWRRLYNLNPAIDKEYFEYHIVNFESYSKQIKIPDTRPLFVSVLADPNILLSSIKQAEIEATSIVHSKHPNLSIALLDEIEIVREFQKIFLNKVLKITNIFRNRGIRGFIGEGYKSVKLVPGRIPSLGMNINLISPIYMGQNRIVDQSIIGEVFYQIANIPFDGDTMAIVTKYIDSNSLKFLDKMGYDNPIRIATYKRLFYTIEQLKNTHAELLNPRERFVLSEPFYVDPDIFGLYSKKRNKFYLSSRDLILREMDPQEAIEYYQNFLGIYVELDPNEVSIEADRVPYIDLDALEQRSMGVVNIIIADPIETNISNPNIYQSPIQYTPQEEYYGFDLKNMVQGII